MRWNKSKGHIGSWRDPKQHATGHVKRSTGESQRHSIGTPRGTGSVDSARERVGGGRVGESAR